MPGTTAPSVLRLDTELSFPLVTVLRASAGSGKTRTLTQRYVQLCLSEHVPQNGLAHILAITFSRSATREMKKNVLDWLKGLARRDEERLDDMAAILAGDREHLPARAEALLECLFDRWSDFQVRTIDSFMAAIFRSSALDFGFDPSFEVALDPAPVLAYGFDLFLREAREASAGARLLDEVTAAMLAGRGEDAAFPWDPAALLLDEVTSLEARLASLDGEIAVLDLEDERRALEGAITEALRMVSELVRRSGLQVAARSALPRLLDLAHRGRFRDLCLASMKTRPVNKPRTTDAGAVERYREILEAWEEADRLAGRYARLVARTWWSPFLRLHAGLGAALERATRARGALVLGDITRKLRAWLDAGSVPDVYFRLGERIAHFLIDEFQDTSPVQWRVLRPLVENTLAGGGTLFVVGDTKQAIYGFRDADWRIMRRLGEPGVFASAPEPETPELPWNYRSRPRIIELCRATFAAADREPGEMQEAVRAGGLADQRQEAHDPGGDQGYAEIVVLDRDDVAHPERDKLLSVMEELARRGYGWGDIAILAPRNEDVVQATAWLVERRIPFLSLSSLDARRRPAANEILALLAFLDCPPDDLAFASFLLGELFAAVLRADGRRAGGHPAGGADSAEALHRFLFAWRRAEPRPPLYKAFQADPDLAEPWARYFGTLFRSVGHLPLYDLVSAALTSFRAFERLPHEEATFARLLEAARAFEATGSNSLGDFLAAAAETGGEPWDIPVPTTPGSVRAMTVHKAKGLGFPVVVLLVRGDSRRGVPYVVHEGADGLELLHLTNDLAERDEELASLLRARRVEDRVDRMNALYVGLTRAKRELYVIGLRGPRDVSQPGKRSVLDLLPVSDFPPRDEKGPVQRETPAEERRADLVHDERLPAPAQPDEARLSHEERRRGRTIHRILELVTVTDRLPAALEVAAARAATEERAAAEEGLASRLAGAIEALGLADCFAPRAGRCVYTERELSDRRGNRVRMDRVVVDPDCLLVVDWKTGSEEIGQPAQEAQVRGYLALLGEVYPGRRREAVLAHLDRREARRLP